MKLQAAKIMGNRATTNNSSNGTAVDYDAGVLDTESNHVYRRRHNHHQFFDPHHLQHHVDDVQQYQADLNIVQSAVLGGPHRIARCHSDGMMASQTRTRSTTMPVMGGGVSTSTSRSLRPSQTVAVPRQYYSSSPQQQQHPPRYQIVRVASEPVIHHQHQRASNHFPRGAVGGPHAVITVHHHMSHNNSVTPPATTAKLWNHYHCNTSAPASASSHHNNGNLYMHEHSGRGHQQHRNFSTEYHNAHSF